MPLVRPGEDHDRPPRDNSGTRCGEHACLIYRLVRVEHHTDAERRRLRICDAGLEIDLGFLRELNNCVSDDWAGPAMIEHEAAAQPLTGFRPGIKVTVVADEGGETQGVVRWTPEAPAGQLFEVSQ